MFEYETETNEGLSWKVFDCKEKEKRETVVKIPTWILLLQKSFMASSVIR